MAVKFNRRDYFVVAEPSGSPPNPWAWEIRRSKTPMGIKLWAGYFKSAQDARLAGEKALAEFLHGLSGEANNS